MPTRSVPLTNFDRLASSFFSRPLPSLARQIPVDAVQRGDKLWLRFDLPGVPEDKLELSVERRVLTVKGERPEFVSEEDHVFLAERPWGAMSREIVLGDTLDLDRIEASFEGGVLTVTVPMAATARSRKIEIGHAPIETTATELESHESTNA
jgi:HSP20 family protein